MFVATMMDKTLLRIGFLAVIFSLTACSGSSTTIEQINSQTQQLLDLKEAHEKGVITDKEYERTEARILEQH